MTQAVSEILQAVEKLTPEERVELENQFFQPDPEWDKDFGAELRRRAEELDSGRVQAIPSEEVFAEIGRLLSGERSR